VCSLGLLLLVAVFSWAIVINANNASIFWISVYASLDVLIFAMAFPVWWSQHLVATPAFPGFAASFKT
jgi:hypothetical protein